jgi:hypothetical protein
VPTGAEATLAAVMRLRLVRVVKKSGDIIHATSGFGGTLCGDVRGFDWRIDTMLGEAAPDRVECPTCREMVERQTVQGTPRTRGYNEPF